MYLLAYNLPSRVEPLLCSAVPHETSLTAHNLRILYDCRSCSLPKVCTSCAKRCHKTHCLVLYWTDLDALSSACSCFDTGKCQAIPPDSEVES